VALADVVGVAVLLRVDALVGVELDRLVGLAARVHLEVEAAVEPGLLVVGADGHVLDHVQRDDVASQFGLLDGAQRLIDGGLGEHVHIVAAGSDLP